MMKKEAYDRFMSKMSSEFGNVDSVKEFLLDAEELAKYGEKRVALENLLENLLENEIYISSELINFISKNSDQTKKVIPYNIAQEYGKVKLKIIVVVMPSVIVNNP